MPPSFTTHVPPSDADAAWQELEQVYRNAIIQEMFEPFWMDRAGGARTGTAGEPVSEQPSDPAVNVPPPASV